MAEYSKGFWVAERSEVRRKYREGLPVFNHKLPGRTFRVPHNLRSIHEYCYPKDWIAVRKWTTFNGLPLLRRQLVSIGKLPHILIHRSDPFPPSTDPRDAEYEVETLLRPKFSVDRLLNWEKFSEVNVATEEGLKAKVTIPQAFPLTVGGRIGGDWTRIIEPDPRGFLKRAEDAYDSAVGSIAERDLLNKRIPIFEFLEVRGPWLTGDPGGCVCGRRTFVTPEMEERIEPHEFYASMRPVETKRFPQVKSEVFRPFSGMKEDEAVEKYVGRSRSAVEGEEPEVKEILGPRGLLRREDSEEIHPFFEICDVDRTDGVRVMFEATRDRAEEDVTGVVGDDWGESLVEAPPDLFLVHGRLWSTEEASRGSLNLEFDERTKKCRREVDEFDDIRVGLLVREARVVIDFKEHVDDTFMLDERLELVQQVRCRFEGFPGTGRVPTLRQSWSYAYAHSFRLMNDVRRDGYSYRIRKTPPWKLDEVDKQIAWWEEELGTSERTVRLERKASAPPRLRVEESGFVLGEDRSVWLWKSSTQPDKTARWTRLVAASEEEIPDLDDEGVTVGALNEGPRHVKGPPASGPREFERVDLTGVADRGLFATNAFGIAEVDFEYMKPKHVTCPGGPQERPVVEYRGSGVWEDDEAWEAKGGLVYADTWREEGPLGEELEEEKGEEEVVGEKEDEWFSGQETPPLKTEFPTVWDRVDLFYVKPGTLHETFLLPYPFNDPHGVQGEGERCASLTRLEDHPVPTEYLFGNAIFTEEYSVPQTPALLEERGRMTLHALLHKRVYERIMTEALQRGNQHTLRVEHLMETRQRELAASLEWDLEIARYFEVLRSMDGIKYGKVEQPSPPRLLRRWSRLRSLTPPEGASDSEDDPSSDESPCPSPPRLVPFVGRVVRKAQDILRWSTPVSFVPGGYQRKYFHMDMEGVSVDVVEFENAKWTEIPAHLRIQAPDTKTLSHPRGPHVIVHLQRRYDFKWFCTNFCWNMAKDCGEDKGPEWVRLENDEFDEAFIRFLNYFIRTVEFEEDVCLVQRREAPDVGLFQLYGHRKDEWRRLRSLSELRTDELTRLEWPQQVLKMYETDTADRLFVHPTWTLPPKGPLEDIFFEGLRMHLGGWLKTEKEKRVIRRRREGSQLGRVDHVCLASVGFPLYRKYMMELRRLLGGFTYDRVADTMGLIHVDGQVPRYLDIWTEDPQREGHASFYAVAESVTPRSAVDEWCGRPERYKGGLPPPPGRVRIALLQTNVRGDKEANLEHVKRLLEHTATRPVEMVFLPEAVDFITREKREAVKMAEPLHGPLMSRYRELAVQHHVWLSVGGFHELLEGTSNEGVEGSPWVANTHVMIDPAGTVVGLYRKAHLFDVDNPEAGLAFKESSFVRPGDKLVTVPDTPLGKIGLGVCYDVRFPEFGAALRAMGADVLTFPSAFTDVTGAAHWESLLRARAIENQCFVIAAAQTGVHYNGRKSWGHSMVVDPWGGVVADAGKSVGCVITEVDLSKLASLRKAMPVIEHKRSGLDLRFPVGEEVNEWPCGGKGPSGGPKFWFPSEEKGEVLFGHVTVKNASIFLENASARAFVNKKCVVPGHVLVTSKRVAGRLSELSSGEVGELFVLAQAVAGVMERVHGANSSTLAVQDGPEAGQTIKHIHVHVLPRKAADLAENDDVYHELANHDKGTEIAWRKDEEMAEEAKELRNHIRTHHAHLLH